MPARICVGSSAAILGLMRRWESRWQLDTAALGGALALAGVGHAGTVAWVGWSWTAWLVVVGAAAAIAATRVVASTGGTGVMALAWSAPGLAAESTSGALAVPAIAMVPVAGLVALVSASASASTSRRVRRWLVPLAVLTILDVVALVCLREPFREPVCLPFCGDNPYLLTRQHGVVRLADQLWSAGAFGIGLVVLGDLLVHHCSAGRRVRSGGAALVMVAAVVMAGHRMAVPRPDGADVFDRVVSGSASLSLAVGTSVMALPAANVIRMRRRTRRLVRQLAAATDLGAVTSVLRTATSDDQLRIRLEPSTWTSADTDAADGRSLTEVRRDGELLAVIEHRSAHTDRVRAALTPVVALAIENAHLLARAQDQLAELADVQRRIIDRTDAQRRQLERDLHDGAQQRLLVLGMDLQAAAARGTGPDAVVLDSLAAEAAEALARLRRLARGSIPGLVDDVGLAEALISLAEESPIPLRLEIGEPIVAGIDRRVTAATYRAVRLVVTHAADSGASMVAVRIDLHDDVVVSVRHDGSVAAVSQEADDRVRAAGGTWTSALTSEGTSYEARFPCG